MALQDTPIHFVDFEGNASYGIVEFGIATVQNGCISNTYSRLCQAQSAIDLADTRIHGIRYADTQYEKPFTEEWDTFVALRQTGVLAAHYAHFDNQLLKSVWSHPPLSPDFFKCGRRIAQWGPWIDTHKLYVNIFPGWESHKLGILIDRLGLEETLNKLAQTHCANQRRHFHCALYDALAAAVLFIHIKHLSGYQNADLQWFLLHGTVAPEQSLQGELFD